MSVSTAHELVVVGAGAAGLWCAARAAELGARVLLLEKTARAGTKVLASGGTRCNLTTTLGPEEAARLFGARGARFLGAAFRELPPQAVRARFHALGVPTVEAPLEKVFPASQRAKDVRDALVGWCAAGGVELRTGAEVRSVRRREERWQLELADGSALAAEQLVLAPGGKSYARTGTSGDGYRWLAELDLATVAPVPALVPLTSPAAWVRALAGISLQEVEARLLAPDGRELGRRARPVVFTHAGISGPGAMDLSAPVARAAGEGRAHPPLRLALDLVPGRTREELRELLLEAARQPGAPLVVNALATALALPRRLLEAALAQAGAPPDTRTHALAKAPRHALVEALKALSVPVDGTLGFDHAEVTAGGLALTTLDPRTLRVNGHTGLFVIGELLDLDGPIGGLNFQAAFATAELAARAATRS